MPAKPYNGEGRPLNPDVFTNLRSEAAWQLRTRLNPEWYPDARDPHRRQPGYHIPPGSFWPRLRDELLALEYHSVGGKTQLILKKDVCARLGHSPDLADAMIQAFFY